MAVINKLRNSKWVFVVVLVSLALFVASDYFSNSSRYSLGDEPSVGEIDGKEIKYTDFDARYKSILQQNTENGYEETDEVREQANSYAWNQLIQELIIDKEYEKIGITITEKEMTELLFSQDAHPIIKQYFSQDGVFNPSNVKAFLKNAKSNPKAMAGFEMLYNEIKLRVKSDKYNSLVKGTYYATSLDAEDQYYNAQTNFNGKSITLNYASIDDKTIKYTDADLKAYINKHKEDFKQKASRNLDYLLFDVRPSKTDTAEIRREVVDEIANFRNAENDSVFVTLSNSATPFDTLYHPRGFYNKAFESKLFASPKDSVVGPFAYDGGFSLFKVIDVKKDSNYFYHIIRAEIPVPGTTKMDTADAIAKGKKIIAEAASAPNTFDFLQSKTRTGELSTVEDMNWTMAGTPGMTEIEKAVKNMSVGQSQVVKNVYGLSIIKLVDPKSYDQIKVAELRKMVEPLKSTIDGVYQKALSVRSDLKGNGDNELETVAKKYGIAKSVVNELKETDKNMSGLPNTRELIRWAYNENTEIKDYSGIIDCGSFYIIAQLTKIREEGTADVEDVREQVTRLVVNEKKAEILKANFETAMKSATTMEAIAAGVKSIVQPFSNVNMNAGGIPFAGNDINLIGFVCGMKTNKISKPVVSKDGVHVFLVENSVVPPAPADLKKDKEMMYGDQRNQVYNMILEGLKKSKNVKDERSKYY